MKSKLTNIVKFPIGDPSADGHGHCDYYIVKCNKSMNELHSIHTSCKKKLGFEIGDICGEYEENTLNPEILDKLTTAGILAILPECDREEITLGEGLSSETVIEIWLTILKKLDDTLVYKIVGDDELPTFNPIDHPGYGVFSN